MMRFLKHASMLLLGLLLLAASAQAQDSAKSPLVKIGTTLGTITLELDAEKAPISVANFLQYAQEDFYNGTIFHRVMPDFMIQGGQYLPSMDMKEEGLHFSISNEWKNGLKNTRGTIAMARLGRQPDSATAQFFINVVDNASLDMPNDGAGYAVFGKVVDGMDVVDAIRTTKVERHPKYPVPQAVTPVEPVVINSVVVANDYDVAGLLAATAEERSDPATKQAAALKKVIAAAEKDSGTSITTTASGLMYVILKPGTGPQPTMENTIKAHYVGTYLDGEKFDSSIDRGQPFEFKPDGVIKAWQETIPMMHVGEKRRIISPPDLAYGDKPDNKGWMVFDMELLEIVK